MRWIGPTIFAAVLLSGCETTIESLMVEEKYFPAKPPRDNYWVGSTLVVDYRRDFKIDFTPICLAVGVSGPTYQGVTESTLIGKINNSSAKGKLTVDEKRIDNINAEISGGRISKIRLEVKNARIVTSGTAELGEIKRILYSQRPYCANGSGGEDEHRKANRFISQIQEVYIADVEYHVDWERAIKLEANAEPTKVISAKLGVTYSGEGNTFTAGKNLIYGMRFYPLPD